MHVHHPPPAGEDSPARRDDEARVLRALWLIAGFMVVEVVGGVLAGSLALLADAGHMLTDTAALAFAYLAFGVARRPADRRRSYGYHRFPVLAAFVNGVSLLAIVAWIAIEAFRRLDEPVEVLAGPMLAVALAGLLVNLAAFRILHAGSRSSVNMRGALLHVMGDLLGSAAAVVAALVIMATGWMPIDPLLSLAVAALILRSGWHLVHQSSHILLEGAPRHLDLDALRREVVEAVAEVDDVHHVHAWSLSEDRTLLTLHAHVAEDADQHRALRQIKAYLRERFGVAHATVQIEHGWCADREGDDGARQAESRPKG